MTVGPFYVVETTLNPGVQYNVGQAEMEHLLELGVLIGGAPAPAEVLDSQLATLINDVNSLVHAAVEQFPPGPHTHVSADLSESGSTGRALLATTSALSARAAIGAGTASTQADVGLGSVDNTSDAAKPVSTLQQAAIAAAQEHAVQRVNHTGAQAISTVTGLQTALDAKAPLASPTFTGTVGGVTKAMVGLGNVDNTADTAKPVSTAQQTALDGKAASSHTHVATTDLTATGTKDATTFLRGDNTWAVPAGGGGGWTAVDASETVKGIVELATNAETQTGTDTVRAITPANLAARTATETRTGVVELATTTEATTGTDTARAVTPAGVKAVADTKASLSLSTSSQSGTSYTLVLADAGKVVETTNAGAVALTVPPNSSVAFPVGTQIIVRQYGAGQVTLTPGSGVTLRSRGPALKTAGQYAEASLMKRATDEWVVSGDITA